MRKFERKCLFILAAMVSGAFAANAQEADMDYEASVEPYSLLGQVVSPYEVKARFGVACVESGAKSALDVPVQLASGEIQTEYDSRTNRWLFTFSGREVDEARETSSSTCRGKEEKAIWIEIWNESGERLMKRQAMLLSALKASLPRYADQFQVANDHDAVFRIRAKQSNPRTPSKTVSAELKQ